MRVRDMLLAKEQELRTELARLQMDLRDVNLALSAVGDANDDYPTPPEINSVRSMTVDDAIVKAVDDGKKTPRAILEHLKSELHVSTTINSIRTRVSKLYAEGRISRDEAGWAMRGEDEDEL